MKMTANFLNFGFRIKVKTKSKYRILNFVFQFIKNTKWHFGHTDSPRQSKIVTIIYERSRQSVESATYIAQ